ncbi:nucleoporin NUP188-like isoform X2 [Physella acuta]|uniref:nucleoporin NUP188-like isoform X2 n=1 Tax=Physella acuta TaxID=109671 RepID=UPI0027DC13A4|nr:nucleoporin NUP188-like isoform X2 [Physella acuta]
MMAGRKAESFGNRQLWQTISIISHTLRPTEYVESELKKNQEKLLHGVSYYKKQSTSSADSLKKDKRLKKEQLEFVTKLSQFLGLDELQSYDLLCSYLFTEYRGSQKELSNIFSHERHSQTLLLKIQEFYYEERLYLLRCLRTVLQSWQGEENAYKDVFVNFIKLLLDNNHLGKKLVEQFDHVCTATIPTKETNGPLMNRLQVMSWAVQNLKEQQELLELLVIFYHYFEMEFPTLQDLFRKFKNQNFGWGQTFKHLIDVQMEKLVTRIRYLEILILLVGLDVKNAMDMTRETRDSNYASSAPDHLILSQVSNVTEMDKLISQLGSEPVHGPIFMAWSILLFIHGELSQTHVGSGEGIVESSQTVNKSRRFGNMGMQLGALDYLHELLESETFTGNSHLAKTAHCIVYSVISALLSNFHEDSFGNTETLYRLCSRLMTWDCIAESLWNKTGESEGLAILYDSAKSLFPVDFSCFIQLNISLAKTSTSSAQKVKKNLHTLGTFTEPLDNNRSQDLQIVHGTSDQRTFLLKRNKHPFSHSNFVIASGCQGVVIKSSAIGRNVCTSTHIIQWETTYNGWQYLMGEIQELLGQVSYGAGMVQTEQVLKTTMVMNLVKEIVTFDPEAVFQFSEILQLGYQLILRFAVLTPSPLELLAHTVHCLSLSVPKFYQEVSHHLKQTGFLPFMTINIKNVTDAMSGDGVNQGLYGCVLTTTECAQGVYVVTIAALDLVTNLIKFSPNQKDERDHTASLLFILREVFPRYQKWRYADVSQRKVIGQKCLNLFHTILNFIKKPNTVPDVQCPSLQETCVFGLLYTEAGRALLEIISTGVDNVQMSLAQQASLLKGAGVDLVELIEISLSLLNRLLLLKPPQQGPSPVEQILSSQPPGHQHQHMVATIAQYIYHRHSFRLPTLATLLLKRLAMVSPMSILACLGNDAEPIRDMFLTRLQAVSEDIQLRVSILELLSVCVDSQHGLIEIFLNVQQQGDGVADKSKHDLRLGRSSCLPPLLDLMEVKKQCTYECPPELLCAALDFVHSLWYGMKETPMAVLRANETFWPSVLAPLTQDLPAVDEQDDLSVQALKLQTKLTSFSLRIIGMELYAMASSQLDSNFKKHLKATFAGGRLSYWSKAVRLSLEEVSESANLPPAQAISELPALNLLLAWKNFLVTSSHFKISDIDMSDKDKMTILSDLLRGVRAQFSANNLSDIKIKLASIASALYFTLVKSWSKDLLDSDGTVAKEALDTLMSTIEESTSGEKLFPSIEIGLLGSVTTILQQCGHKLDNLSSVLHDLLGVVCSIFLNSSWHVPALLETTANQQTEALGNHVKLQVVTCCLLVEILHMTKDLETSLQVIQEHGIISSLLSTTEALFKARQGISYIYSSLLLLIKIASTETGALMLVNNNLISQLCLVLTSCYAYDEDNTQSRVALSKALRSLRPASVTWHSLYCLCLDLFSSMLRVLKHSFLEDALNVIGVHQDRMYQALLVARVNLSKTTLDEAEATCGFVLELCAFHKQWRYSLPHVLAKIVGSLMAMIQTYMALLIRPRYLLHLLEHAKSQDGLGKCDSILQVPSILQHQSSLDDVEQPSKKLVQVQHSMLRLVGKGLSCLKHFTPGLPEILFDQGVDVTEWEPILRLGFGTPSLDDDVEGITFGTLLNCVTVCVRHLSRMDGKASPHRNSPDDSAKHCIPRPVVQFVLEVSLDILMSQACRYLRDPNLMARDRQFLKRELGTELNSCLSPLHRHLRRGAGDRSLSLTPPQQSSNGIFAPTTPQANNLTWTSRTSTPPQLNRSISQTFPNSPDPNYFRLVQTFVQKVLK